MATQTQESTRTDSLLKARDRYLARGIATAPLVIQRAAGAKVWDVDGREYLDFVGGIDCQNMGHNPEAVMEALHQQIDDYLTSA